MNRKILTKFYIVFCALFFSISIAEPSYSIDNTLQNKPVNYESFKNKITDSLVGISCNNLDFIGFSATWSVTDSDKNNGINSKIFTSGQSLFSCGRYDAVAPITYRNKPYTGKIWNSGKSLPDFGGFSTSAIIPSLPLWGSSAPEINSWVAIVRFASAFGFIWAESKVVAYNPETLIFAVEPTSPKIEKDALVFNSKGDFIGIVSKTAVKQTEGLTTVHGAPLQCPLNQYETTPAVTNCSSGTYAQNIWTTTGPTSVANEEFISSVISFIDSSFKQKNTLKGIVSKSKIISKSKKTAYLKIFTKIDSEYKKVDGQISLIRSMSSAEDFRKSTNSLFENWKLWTKDFTKITNEIASGKI